MSTELPTGKCFWAAPRSNYCLDDQFLGSRPNQEERCVGSVDPHADLTLAELVEARGRGRARGNYRPLDESDEQELLGTDSLV